MKKRLFFAGLFIVVAAPLLAQTQLRYNAKFICGKAPEEVTAAFANAPGIYFTTINVTNPSRETAVRGMKRFSIGLLAQRAGRVTKFMDWSLKAGNSMQVDCGDIYKRLDMPPGDFIEGYVHFVGSPVRFDVAAVYTVSDGDRPVSIDVEHLTPVR